jgi:hypothetical protein
MSESEERVTFVNVGGDLLLVGGRRCVDFLSKKRLLLMLTCRGISTYGIVVEVNFAQRAVAL